MIGTFNANRTAEALTTQRTDAISERLNVWFDRGGRRCVAPPEFLICDWELRNWFEYKAPDAEKLKREAEMAQWRKENPGEVYEKETPGPDKRRKEYKHARVSG